MNIQKYSKWMPFTFTLSSDSAFPFLILLNVKWIELNVRIGWGAFPSHSDSMMPQQNVRVFCTVAGKGRERRLEAGSKMCSAGGKEVKSTAHRI
jgi:hypothetical protein